MWVSQLIMAIIGISGGVVVAAGLFGFIVGLGVISDFADRTHTGKYVLLYEDAVICGGILGNLMFIYDIEIYGQELFLVAFGLFSGIFLGGWAMALTEVLNVFPIFIRRIKLLKCIPYVILSIAIGKGVTSILYFFLGW